MDVAEWKRCKNWCGILPALLLSSLLPALSTPVEAHVLCTESYELEMAFDSGASVSYVDAAGKHDYWHFHNSVIVSIDLQSLTGVAVMGAIYAPVNSCWSVSRTDCDPTLGGGLGLNPWHCVLYPGEYWILVRHEFLGHPFQCTIDDPDKGIYLECPYRVEYAITMTPIL